MIGYSFGSAFARIEEEDSSKFDKTISLLASCVKNLRTIKTMVWELHFFRRVSQRRGNEIRLMVKRSVLEGVVEILELTSPILAMILMLFGLIYNGYQLNLPAFTMFIQVETILIGAISALPHLGGKFFDIRRKMERINHFLDSDNIDLRFRIDDQSICFRNDNKNNDLEDVDYDIELVNGNFFWNKEIEDNADTDDDNKNDREYSLEDEDFTKDKQNASIKLYSNGSDDSSKLEPLLKVPSCQKFNTKKKENSDIKLSKKANILKENNGMQSSPDEKKTYKTTYSNYEDSFDKNSFVDEPNFYLQNINFKVKKGQFVMLIGKLASGKSSLLYSLLGEMSLTPSSHKPSKTYITDARPPTLTQLKINQNIGFIAQNPWLMTKSIKNNILLGKPYNEDRFNHIIELSGLNEDLQKFKEGIDYHVGESGESLSAGQKVRLALAMNLYHNPDVFLLDDPLSSLDEKLSNFIFHKTILEELKDKTIVMATNSLQYLYFADYVYVFDEGKIAMEGTPDVVSQHELVQNFSKTDQKPINLELQPPIVKPSTNQKIIKPSRIHFGHHFVPKAKTGFIGPLASLSNQKRGSGDNIFSEELERSSKKFSLGPIPIIRTTFEGISNDHVITDQDQIENCDESGGIPLKTIWVFFMASGGLTLLFFSLGVIIVQALLDIYMYQYILEWAKTFSNKTKWDQFHIYLILSIITWPVLS